MISLKYKRIVFNMDGIIINSQRLIRIVAAGWSMVLPHGVCTLWVGHLHLT